MGGEPSNMARVKQTTSEAALEACIAEMRGAFDVADRDCCRTAGWAFERLWGVNPVVGADYTSHRGALRFLRRFGGTEACHDALAKQAGLIECAPQAGVIGSIKTKAGCSPLSWVLAINIDGNEWATMGPNGLCVVKSSGRSWGVPEWA